MLNMNQIAVLRVCRGSTTWNNYVAAVGDKFNLASFVIRRVNCRPCILCAAIVDWPAILLLYRNLRFYTEGRLVEYYEIWDTLSLSQFACSAFIALSNVVSFVFCSCSRSNDWRDSFAISLLNCSLFANFLCCIFHWLCVYFCAVFFFAWHTLLERPPLFTVGVAINK